MERNLIAREIDDLAGLRLFDVPGNNATAVRAAALPIGKFKPTDENSLVMNRREFKLDPSIKITNWANRMVQHNTHVGYNKSRKSEKIFQLAIHETGSGLDNDSNAPGYAPKSPDWTSSHMSVLRDGSVRQFNDTSQFLHHVGVFNEAGIGIEFVNYSWLNKIEDGAASYYKELSPDFLRDKPRGDNFLYCFWGSGFNVFRIPPSYAQLETMVKLIHFYIIDLPGTINKYKMSPLKRSFAALKIANWLSIPVEEVVDSVVNELCPIERNWINIISRNNIPSDWKLLDNPSPGLPKDKEAEEKNLFVFTKAYGLFEKGKKIDSVLVEQLKGVYPHGAFVTGSKHNDGNFIVLYAWLRIEKGYSKEDALHICKVLMERHYFRFNKFRRKKPRIDKHTKLPKFDENNNPLFDIENYRIVLLDVRDSILRQALNETYPIPTPLLG